MIQVKFSHVSEIRMGSPFNVATVEILGEWQPRGLKGSDFCSVKRDKKNV